MANRNKNSQVQHALSEVELITARMTGGGAASNCVVSAFSLDLVSATNTATGVFNLVFAKKYPQEVMPLVPSIVGTTTGMTGIYTAFDPVAGTATLKLSVGSVATDPATTDSIRLGFLVRNSGRNPSSLA